MDEGEIDFVVVWFDFFGVLCDVDGWVVDVDVVVVVGVFVVDDFERF